MGIDSTYTTRMGSLTLDWSQVPQQELDRLDQLNAAGALQPADVLLFLERNPDVKFSYVSRDGLEPPDQDLPHEELDYDGMSADVNAIIAQAQRALMRANQGLRRTMLEMAQQQRTVIMDEAKQGLEKDLAAADKNFEAAKSGAIAEGMAGGVQIGFSAKGMKDMRKSVKLGQTAERLHPQIEKVTTAKHEGLTRIKKDQAEALKTSQAKANEHIDQADKADAQIETLKMDRARHAELSRSGPNDDRLMHEKIAKHRTKEIQAKTQVRDEHAAKAEAEVAKMPGIQKAGDDDAKAFDRNMTGNIRKLETKVTQDTAEADRLVKGTMVWGQLGGAVGQIVNSIGKGLSAEESLAAAQKTAYSKMDHAEQEMANMAYQQLMDLANAARDVINDMRNTQSSTAQSTQQLQSSVARNMA